MHRYAQRRLAARMFKDACGEQPKRLGLTAPQFNLREIAKQMVLLEDHCAHPYKHCPDCIRKHLLTIEALAEEATSMDVARVYSSLSEALAERARQWMEDFQDGGDLPVMGQQVRGVRKDLVPLVCDPRDMTTRVASRYMAASGICDHRRVDLEG